MYKMPAKDGRKGRPGLATAKSDTGISGWLANRSRSEGESLGAGSVYPTVLVERQNKASPRNRGPR